MSEVAIIEGEDAPTMDFKKDYHVTAHITSQLLDHANELLCLFSSELPLMVPLRPTDANKLQYTVGDASADGLSIVTQYPDLIIQGQDGLWDENFC